MEHMEQLREEVTKEDVINKIKELDTVQNKVKTAALHFHLEKKKVLDEQLEKEIAELTLKYEKLSLPIYAAQSEIITGARAVKDEEIADIESYLKEEEKSQLESAKADSEKISGFWLKALKGGDMTAAEIKEKDEAILESIKDIKHIPDETDPLKFQIVFTFYENDYFTNETLTKTFELKSQEIPQLGKGTEIDWKEGKDTTVKTVKKTQKNKKSGAKRTVTKEVPDESFFNFFKDHEMVNEDDKDEEDEEQLEAEELLAIDYDIARTLIDEVLPYSLEYFLELRVPEDGEYGDYMDEEDEHDDDDDCDHDHHKDKKPRKKKSTDSNKSGGDGQKGEKPECKQQ